MNNQKVSNEQIYQKLLRIGEKARLTALIHRTQREAKKNGLTTETLSVILNQN